MKNKKKINLTKNWSITDGFPNNRKYLASPQELHREVEKKERDYLKGRCSMCNSYAPNLPVEKLTTDFIKFRTKGLSTSNAISRTQNSTYVYEEFILPVV